MADNKKVAFIFPGQGAQKPGMGMDFNQEYRAAKDTFEEADDLLGRSLSELIFSGSEEELKATHNSQIALYVEGIAILRTLQALFPQLHPYVAGGLSLGEYTALTAENRLNFSDGLQLVQMRGQLMSAACEKKRGTMAVLVGLDTQTVDTLVSELKLPKDIWVANYNCPGQIVISGTLKGVEACIEKAIAAGAKKVLPLQVHGAFHSGLMQEAQDHLSRELEQVQLKPSTVLHAMNVTGSLTTDNAEIKRNLAKQVTHSVRWQENMSSMESEAVLLYIEIGGAGRTLNGMLRRLNTQAHRISIESIDDLGTLDEQLSRMESAACK